MTEARKYTRLKAACYFNSISMSVIANLSPLLFLGFHDLYGISYSLLGLLVLINFSTQLAVDLLLSFFSHKLNVSIMLKMTPMLAVAGLCVFAAAPFMFPTAPFAGLLIGTLIFSAAGGLSEALISPVIAAIPSKDPDREMSKLHSVYAWGVVAIVPLCSLFLLAFGKESWMWLSLGAALIPLTAVLLSLGTVLPPMKGEAEGGSEARKHFKNPTLWLCTVAIFLGGAVECTMAQWASGYLEGALGIDKIYGDVFGVALFGLMLAIGRTLYSKFGKQPERILFFGAIGSLSCYLAAALSPHPIIGLIACAMTGLCSSMLWPGTLIVSAQRIPTGGVLLYALMAAGGDLGASVGPQLVGAVADAAAGMTGLLDKLSMTPDELGLRLGMLVASLFPLAAIFAFRALKKSGNVNKD